jgi:calpain-7
VQSINDDSVTAPFISKTTGNYRSGFCFLDLEDIPVGIYQVRPSTYLPNEESPFFLKFKSSTNVVVERIS